MTAIDISPIKTHGVPYHMRVSYGKRELSAVHDQYWKQLSVVLDLSDEELLETNSISKLQQPEKDYIVFHELMKKLKEKMQHEDTRRVQKIQILTLVPAEWGIPRTAQYFNVHILGKKSPNSHGEKKTMVGLKHHGDLWYFNPSTSL